MRKERGPGRRDRRIPEELMVSLLIPDGPPLAMYDLGVGCFGEFMTLKQVWPGMALFGCEPCQAEYDELVPIFDGLLIRAAIGSETGIRLIWESDVGVGGSRMKYTQRPALKESIVDVMTLDQFDAVCGKPDKILLWMDIEESELDALQSGPELLSSGRVHWLNVETRNENSEGPTTADINAFLDGYGYYPVERYNVNGRYPEAPGDMVYFKKGVVPLRKCNWGVHPG